jgi:16S rRNA (guanine966-N2)-methyltransferase
LLRIIAGRLKGRRLHTLRGSVIRPTADRVREALFNILGPKPVGATVLDLFSGTGALGIEAISRGARTALFVDSHADALALLRDNLKTCGLETCTRVVRWNVTDNLNGLRPFGPVFDLVFMDPPYRRELVQPVLTGLSRAQLLAADGLVVVEHAPEETIDPNAAGMRLEDQRRYGRTRISFFSAIPSDIASAGVPC